MSISNQTDFFLDFQQFKDLKVQARGHSDDAASAVAQQFEGLFVQQMLAAMRSAAKIDSGQDSSYMDFYQDMYDKQLAQTVAGQERLGFSRLILRHMPGRESGEVENTGAVEPAANLEYIKPSTKSAAGLEMINPSIKPAPHEADSEITVADAAVLATSKSPVVVSRVVADDFAEVDRMERVNSGWQSADHFIADILPQAQSAAKSLGVSAELLLAQSALETGWGKHTIKFADGRSSNNLFGIKAGADWQGDSLQKTSLEHQDGILQNRVSSFRAYATPAQSLADYVDFIKTNPRYQQALQHAGDDQAYIREIHNAGYATDPLYADKIIGILNGETLQRTLAGLNPGVTDHA
ncbi:MAG: flagellar assembly peptidoglycan hydrolase FlgJ [Gammaproteobacteria bacterium]